MRPARQANGDGGFALVEVLVALALLAVGTVGVLSAVLAARAAPRDAALRHRAALLLQDKYGEILTAPYAGESIHGVSDDGLMRWTVIGVPWEGAPERPVEGRRRRGAPVEVLPIYEVRVDVSWRSHRGEGRVETRGLVGAALHAASAEPPRDPSGAEVLP
jgi:prepilin-type N-terminal cleavage/methylation domain-containing protein